MKGCPRGYCGSNSIIGSKVIAVTISPSNDTVCDVKGIGNCNGIGNRPGIAGTVERKSVEGSLRASTNGFIDSSFNLNICQLGVGSVRVGNIKADVSG